MKRAASTRNRNHMVRHCSRASPIDYGAIWDKATVSLQRDQFALLDVSTNADLLGVSFGTFGTERMAMLTTMLPASGGFPLQVEGMDVRDARF